MTCLVALASILKTETGTFGSKNQSIRFTHLSTSTSFPIYSAMTRPLAVSQSFMNQNRPLLTPWSDATAARGKVNRKTANKYVHIAC
jgi:hypothetical protein